MSANMQEFRSLPLAAIRPSNSAAQTERREYYVGADLEKLAATIKSDGVHQNIVVRPFRDEVIKGEAFEIVAGERRWRAAKIAGLKEIPARVRELSDEQAEELQLVENVQRESLHEMAEAQGYESLHKRGLSVEAIAEKCGTSTGTVYARMKLLALCAEARKTFYQGKITASVGLLISRVPVDEQQERVLRFATEADYHQRVPTYKQVFEFIQEHFLLKLSTAPFPKDDATLVAAAGACGPCPMRTGNQPELFGDVKGADVCTNPKCFQSKKSAHVSRELQKAKAGGDKVIRGGDARRILPGTYHQWDSSTKSRQLRNGYARPGDKCLDDPKKRTYAELAGKDAPRTLLQHPDSGRVEKIFKIEDIADLLKAKGIKPKPVPKDSAESRAQDDERRKEQAKIEIGARRAIVRAAMAAAPGKLARVDLEQLIVCAIWESGHGQDDELYDLLGWGVPNASSSYGKREQAFRARLSAMTEQHLAQLAAVATVISDAASSYSDAKELEAIAARLGVDVRKVRAAATLEQKAAVKTKKTKSTPAKKKAKSK